MPAGKYQPIGKYRVIMDDRSAIVDCGNIIGSYYRNHAGGIFHRLVVDTANPCMRSLAQAERNVAGSCKFGNIINVGGLATHVQFSRLVRIRLPGRDFARIDSF